MKTKYLIAIICIFSVQLEAQNRKFTMGFSLGVGQSKFQIPEVLPGKIHGIIYPIAIIQLQAKIDKRWASYFALSNHSSGGSFTLDNSSPFFPIIEKTKMKIDFVRLSVQPRYFLNKSTFVGLGPEISLLVDSRIHAKSSTESYLSPSQNKDFSKNMYSFSSTLGYSKKVDQSRKHAKYHVDIIWSAEFKLNFGITNVYSKTAIIAPSYIRGFEIITGISFGSTYYER